jgi:hypothetical protein
MLHDLIRRRLIGTYVFRIVSVQEMIDEFNVKICVFRPSD